MVESDSLTACSDNALLGGTGESEGGDGEFWDLSQSGVVGDGADLDDDLRFAVLGVGGLLYDAAEGKRGTVVLGEEEAVEDDLDQL